MRKLLKNKWVKRFGYFLFLILFTLSILEIAYRFQWVDFYKAELKGLNPELDDTRDNILIFGDSFAANPEGFTRKLKDHFAADFNVVNCAISGTSPRHASYMASRRISEFKPKRVICQLYLGNDLHDELLETNWSNLSFSRNVYWWWGRKFRVLMCLNQKNRQVGAVLNADGIQNSVDRSNREFSAAKYTPRCKMLLNSNPNYIGNTYELKGDYLSACETTIQYLDHIKSLCDEGVGFDILVIPHCASVTEKYYNNFVQLGMSPFDSKNDSFVKKLKGKFGAEHVWNSQQVLQNAERDKKPVYYSNDEHFNSTGDSIVAKYLIEKLIED